MFLFCTASANFERKVPWISNNILYKIFWLDINLFTDMRIICHSKRYNSFIHMPLSMLQAVLQGYAYFIRMGTSSANHKSLPNKTSAQHLFLSQALLTPTGVVTDEPSGWRKTGNEAAAATECAGKWNEGTGFFLSSTVFLPFGLCGDYLKSFQLITPPIVYHSQQNTPIYCSYDDDNR